MSHPYDHSASSTRSSSSSSLNSLPESFTTAAVHPANTLLQQQQQRHQQPPITTTTSSLYATPTNQWPPGRIALHPPDQPPSFTLVCLGVGGGPLESDCSCYLLKPADQAWEESGAIVLEGGSWLGALIRVCEPSGPDSPFYDIDFPFDDPALRAGLIGSFSKTFLISHAHLDHILGLVLGSASLPGKRTVLGLKPTLENIMDLFNGKIWPKLASWKEDEPHTVYHMKPLEQRTPTPLLANSLSVLPFALSHGLNPSVPPAPPTPTSVYTSTMGSFSAAFNSNASSSAAAAAAAANASYLSKRYSLPLSSLSLNMGIMGLPGAPGGSSPSPLAAQRFLGAHPGIGPAHLFAQGSASSGSSTSSEYMAQQQQLQHHSGSLFLSSFSERPIFTSPFAPDPARQLERNSISSGPGNGIGSGSTTGSVTPANPSTSPMSQPLTTPTPTESRTNPDPFSSLAPKSAASRPALTSNLSSSSTSSTFTANATSPRGGLQALQGPGLQVEKDSQGRDISGLGLTTNSQQQGSAGTAAAAVRAATAASSTHSATPGILGRTTMGRTKAPRRPRTAQGSERVPGANPSNLGGGGSSGKGTSPAANAQRGTNADQQAKAAAAKAAAAEGRANARKASVDRSPPALDSTAFF
ncbi:hypothetical protein CF326_g9147, partial [Tilletia indica]